jgi:hypothetical protein
VRAALALTTSISELIRKERATLKNSQLATARRVWDRAVRPEGRTTPPTDPDERD